MSLDSPSLFATLVFTAALAGAAGSLPAAAPESPQGEVIHLFNGRDLSGFYTHLAESKYEDPKRVFRVHDQMLHVTGDGLGYLATKKDYANYRLVTEFRWGQHTLGNRRDRTKDSGVLVHAVGADGNAGPWMSSIECQVIQGGVGDFIVIAPRDNPQSALEISLTAEVTEDRDGESVWKRGAPRKRFTSGRINWYGRDPDWEDVLGFRGKQDVESPGSEWTRMEVVCDGDHILVYVNGTLVNEGFAAAPSAGKILIQTELAEIFFRKIELHPLGTARD